MPSKVQRIDTQAYDIWVLRPMRSSSYGLTDEEANALYAMWKATPSGVKTLDPVGDEKVIRALKSKGYLSVLGGPLELTEKGRKIIVEMVTHEPNALQKDSQMPAYSEIKGSQRRAKQTFTGRVKKRADKEDEEARSFNLRRQRREAGVMDWLTSPMKDWWSRQWHDVKEQWHKGKSEVFGQSYSLLRKVRRLLPSAYNDLNRLFQHVKAGGAINPQALAATSGNLLRAMTEFRGLVGNTVGIPEVPDPANNKYLSQTIAGIDREGFVDFYNDLSRSLSAINEQTALQYERLKGTGAATPALKEGPEERNLPSQLVRTLMQVNVDAGIELIPQAVMKELGEGGAPGAPGVKLSEKLKEKLNQLTDESEIGAKATELSSEIISAISIPLRSQVRKFMTDAQAYKDKAERIVATIGTPTGPTWRQLGPQVEYYERQYRDLMERAKIIGNSELSLRDRVEKQIATVLTAMYKRKYGYRKDVGGSPRESTPVLAPGT